MKKTISCLLLLVFVSIKIVAQDFPDFGSPSKEELELSECTFDKDAGALVLIDEAFSYSEDNQQLITSRHVRIKILKKSGENAANISIPFIRLYNFEHIIELQALTINIDEKKLLHTQKIGRKSFYTNKINDVLGEINFAFPAVKEGSILEYQYKSVKKSYYGLEDWRFQREIPVLTSRYHIKLIPSKRFSYRIIQNPETETSIFPGKDDLFVEMRKIPALTSEPYMDCKEDYLQRINFKIDGFDSRWGGGQVGTLTSSWGLLNAQLLLNKDFGYQITNPLKAATGFIDSMKLVKDDSGKMKSIFSYVRSHMTWNSANAVLAGDVNKIWEMQSGNTAEINMVLVNLLNAAKLKAFPLLVSKRYNGKVDTNYAYSDQFNALFACVELNGKKIILDAADKYNTVFIPPVSILNTAVFMVTRFNGELFTVTEDTAAYKETIQLNMEIAGDSVINGSALIDNEAYAMVEKKRQFKTDSVKLKESYQEQDKLPVQVLTYHIEGIDNDSSCLTEKIDFTAPLTGSGAYHYIPLQLFSSFSSNPFIAEKRYSDINFGYKRSLTIRCHVKYSDLYILEALPDNTSLIFDGLNIRFTRSGVHSKENKSADFEIKVDIAKSVYEVKDYTALKNAYRAIISKLAGQIVLKRKQQPL